MTRDVYGELRREILSGEREPGMALTETELASYFCVSRTPVREALFKLRQDGLVERAGRGLAVRSYTTEQILECYEVRLVLEGLAARLAAVRRTELDLVWIKAAYKGIGSTQGRDTKALRDANKVFRDSIWAAAHNAMLTTLLEYIYAHTPQFADSMLTNPTRFAGASEEYAALLSAIEDRRAEDAEEWAKAHLSNSIEARIEWLAANQPDQQQRR